MEQPLYILSQHQPRATLPKIGSLIILGTIFYFGILLNIALLQLSASQETIVKITSLIVVFIIIILGIYHSLHQAKLPYTFYSNQLLWGKKSILYSALLNTTPKQDLMDKFFKTYTINLGQGFFLRNIPREVPIQPYLQQMQQYAARKSSVWWVV